MYVLMRKYDSCPIRQDLQRTLAIDPFKLLDKCKDVAFGTAAEAVVETAFR
jgi:hypothetical protein